MTDLQWSLCDFEGSMQPFIMVVQLFEIDFGEKNK